MPLINNNINFIPWYILIYFYNDYIIALLIIVIIVNKCYMYM